MQNNSTTKKKTVCIMFIVADFDIKQDADGNRYVSI